MTANVVFDNGPSCVDRYFDGICGLYAATFSLPPFVWTDGDAAHHRAMLAEARTSSTFDATVATAGQDVVGFAYGHRLPVNHGWWQDFAVTLPADVTAEWDGRTFALLDWAVAAKHRGSGIGRRSLDSLLARRREQRAILSVQPTAVDTQAIYRHLGWRKIGRKGPIRGVRPPYWDIFTRSLG
jgi:ribosomal protein S18 acetylase RimI-like enzyme